MTPQHLHLALNHLPFLGAAFALIPLLVGLLRHHLPTLNTGLVIAALATGSTPLVFLTGEEAYEVYEEGPVARLLGPGGEEAMHVHEERAEDWVWIFYTTAALSTLGLLAVCKEWPYGSTIAYLATLFCLLSVLAGIWIAESGGKIRRPDFRSPGGVMFSQDNELHHDDD